MPRKKKAVETELGAPAEYVDEAKPEQENVVPGSVELNPGQIVIHEDLDRLQLIDLTLSKLQKAIGDQIAVVDTLPMNGVRGTARQRLISKFRRTAMALGYTVESVITIVP